MLEAGNKAPEFTLPSGDGDDITLSNLQGKKVVLYFYPKDNTPGCTTEAIDFSTHKQAFEKEGAVILGVSKDSVKKHQNFAAKQNLTITLLSDEDGGMLEKYGTWVEKSMYGRKYMGIARVTYLIDEKGIIRQVWPKVKVKGHAEDVLEAVKTLA